MLIEGITKEFHQKKKKSKMNTEGILVIFLIDFTEYKLIHCRIGLSAQILFSGFTIIVKYSLKSQNTMSTITRSNFLEMLRR